VNVRRQTWFANALCALLMGAPAGIAAAQVTPAADVSPTAAALTVMHAEADAVQAARAARAHQDAARARGASPLKATADLPGLRHRADGSYRFDGVNFTATIAPDGQVEFRDKYFGVATRMRPLTPVNPDAMPGAARMISPTPPALALPLKMDLYAWIEHKLGNDPHLSERRWFLERTRELREDLARIAVDTELQHALLRIWSDARLSLQQRKQATFELWSETARDERGSAVRAQIVAFVRQRCPKDSACAFHEGELARLNRARAPEDVFSPYVDSSEKRASEIDAPAR
jgi:hypothetical protein